MDEQIFTFNISSIKIQAKGCNCRKNEKRTDNQSFVSITKSQMINLLKDFAKVKEEKDMMITKYENQLKALRNTQQLSSKSRFNFSQDQIQRKQKDQKNKQILKRFVEQLQSKICKFKQKKKNLLEEIQWGKRKIKQQIKQIQQLKRMIGVKDQKLRQASSQLKTESDKNSSFNWSLRKDQSISNNTHSVEIQTQKLSKQIIDIPLTQKQIITQTMPRIEPDNKDRVLKLMAEKCMQLEKHIIDLTLKLKKIPEPPSSSKRVTVQQKPKSTQRAKQNCQQISPISKLKSLIENIQPEAQFFDI